MRELLRLIVINTYALVFGTVPVFFAALEFVVIF